MGISYREEQVSGVVEALENFEELIQPLTKFQLDTPQKQDDIVLFRAIRLRYYFARRQDRQRGAFVHVEARVFCESSVLGQDAELIGIAFVLCRI